MNSANRCERFRAILSGQACVSPASVFDPISARIATDLGYEAGVLAGSVASMAVLGAPDLILLSLSEFSDLTHRICRASDLPLMVDADHGYGNALNVIRTVEELGTAGAAALTIEDTLLPKAFGQDDEPRLLSIEEGIGKMRAALWARRDDNLVIIGRTSAATVSGIQDAIARAKAYESTGVDAVLIVGIKRRDQLDQIALNVNIPIILAAAGPDLADLEYLSSRGVRIWLRGHQSFPAAVRAVHETLKAIRDGAAPEKIDTVAPQELMDRLTRSAQYENLDREFLGMARRPPQ